jgi:hypothetical protein
MKIAELISGKEGQDRVSIGGFSLPVTALKKLLNEGYENILLYKENKTFSLWGKNCTVCFTQDHLEKMVGSG